MSKTLFFAILASVVALFGCPDTTNAEETKPAMTTETNALPKPAKSGLLPIDGLNYYYAIYGQGRAPASAAWRSWHHGYVRADPAETC